MLSFATESIFIPEDGSYSIEATLVGGSGRATIDSPLSLAVKDGSMSAIIVWSSPYYEWMQVGEARYDAEKTAENSIFDIRIDQLDVDIALTALTLAMSEPHEIDYILHFDSTTIKSVQNESNKPLILIVSSLIFLGIIGVFNASKKRKGAGK